MTLTLPANAHADNAQRAGGVADLPFSPPQAIHSPRHALSAHDAHKHAFAERMRMWDAVAEVRRETVAFVRRMPEYRREEPDGLSYWDLTTNDVAGLGDTLHALEAGLVHAGERPPVHLPIPAPDGFAEALALFTTRVYDLAERIEGYLSEVGAGEFSSAAGERVSDVIYAGLRCAAWAARQAGSVLNGEVRCYGVDDFMPVLEAAEIEAEWPGLATA